MCRPQVRPQPLAEPDYCLDSGKSKQIVSFRGETGVHIVDEFVKALVKTAKRPLVSRNELTQPSQF